MSGCLDNIHCDCGGIDWDAKRNAVASIVAGVMFFGGWWLYIDTAAIYTHEPNQWNNVYIIVGIAGTVAMFMVNAVSNSQVRGESMSEGMLGTRGSRLWLMSGFVLAFAALVAAMWIMFADYVVARAEKHNNGTYVSDPSTELSTWPGIALFLHNFLIFVGTLVYKFGRTEELWG